MSDGVFYKFNKYPEKSEESLEESLEEYKRFVSDKLTIFDPIEILFESYDKDFVILSSLDYFFNFTKTLGSILSPQELDENYHVFNLTSKRGYSEYILYRRPTGFVFELFFEHLSGISNEGFNRNIRTFQKSEGILENLQLFSKVETFTDVRKVGQYPEVIIFESRFFELFSKELMQKLVGMLKTLNHNAGVSFFILDLDFSFKIFEYLTYIELLFSRCHEIFFVIPSGIPFYEEKYFLCFVFGHCEEINEKIEKNFSEFPKWLEKMLSLRRTPKLEVFPYKYIIKWNLLRGIRN
jgi:hypothetical protein